jgi:hypothetical protein
VSFRENPVSGAVYHGSAVHNGQATSPRLAVTVNRLPDGVESLPRRYTVIACKLLIAAGIIVSGIVTACEGAPSSRLTAELSPTAPAASETQS